MLETSEVSLLETSEVSLLETSEVFSARYGKPRKPAPTFRHETATLGFGA